MAKPAKENELPQPGPLRIREPVRVALFSLRHLMQVTLDTLTPPRKVRAATVQRMLVESVEEALRCSLPDEILACFANQDDELDRLGFEIGNVYDYTREARKLRCPKDLVAVGRDECQAFFCIPRRGARDRGVQIVDFDISDGDEHWYDLGDWLAEKAKSRCEFLTERYPALAQWKPSPDELAAFKPALTE